jgi:hypothetical protein
LPSHEGITTAPIVLSAFQISEGAKFFGIGPVEINIPLGARYLALWVKREGSINPTAS